MWGWHKKGCRKQFTIGICCPCHHCWSGSCPLFQEFNRGGVVFLRFKPMNVGSKNSRIPQILEYVRKINEEFLFIRNDDTVVTMLSVNDAMLLSNLFSCCIIPQRSLVSARNVWLSLAMCSPFNMIVGTSIHWKVPSKYLFAIRAQPDWTYECPTRTGLDTQICRTCPAGQDWIWTSIFSYYIPSVGY